MKRLTPILLAAALTACNFSEEYGYELPPDEKVTAPIVRLNESAEQLTTTEEFGLWLCPAIEGEWDSLSWWVDERYAGSSRKIHLSPTLGTHTITVEAHKNGTSEVATAHHSVTVRVVAAEELPLNIVVPQSTYSAVVGETLRIAPIVFAPAPKVEFVWSANGAEVGRGEQSHLDFVAENEGTHNLTLTAGGQMFDFTVKCIAAERVTPRAANSTSTAAVTKVWEYTPAAGQFINTGVNGRTPTEYAEQSLAKGSVVSLGGFGGRLVVGFDHSVMCSGDYDLRIRGNAFDNSSEPGVVWVMQDSDGNGLPDDTWYELRGSEHDADSTQHNAAIVYLRDAAHPLADIQWRTSDGKCGIVERNIYHTANNYYPEWEHTHLTLWGTLLPSRVVLRGSSYIALPYDSGYVDNFGSDRDGVWNRFRISDAVRPDGTPANLSHIDFVMIQSAVSHCAPNIGEISTEVSAIEDISLLSR